jgi:hypothetical protein
VFSVWYLLPNNTPSSLGVVITLGCLVIYSSTNYVLRKGIKTVKNLTSNYTETGLNLEAFIASMERLTTLPDVEFKLPAIQAALVAQIVASYDKSLRVLEATEAGLAEYAEYTAKQLEKGEAVRPFEEFRFGGKVYGTSAFVSVHDKRKDKATGSFVWLFNAKKALAVMFIRKNVANQLAEAMSGLKAALDAEVLASQEASLAALSN